MELKPKIMLMGLILVACIVPLSSVSFAPPKDIAGGSIRGVSSMDAGDLDGDGRADVVVLELRSGIASLVLRKSAN